MSEPTTDALAMDAIRERAEQVNDGTKPYLAPQVCQDVPLLLDEIERQAKEIERLNEALKRPDAPRLTQEEYDERRRSVDASYPGYCGGFGGVTKGGASE